MKHDGFTLIEVIVVITIITLLVGFLVVDFNGARRNQELNLTVQQTLALMEQSRANVDSGRVEEEDDYLCLGGYFELDEVPQLVKMDFDPVLESCDFDTHEESVYGTVQGSAVVGSIDIDQSQDKIWAMFVPPEADLVFYSNQGSFVGDGSVSLYHTGNEEMLRFLNFSSLTNQVSLADAETS